MEQTTVSQESKGFYKLNWLGRCTLGPIGGNLCR